MELSSKAISELKALRQAYERREKLFDLKFIKNTLEIVESEDRFKNILSLVISKDSKIDSAEENYGEIMVNLANMKAYSCRELPVFDAYYTKDEEYKIRNYFVMYTLLHESSHAWQDCGLDDDKEVNRLYHKINKRIDFPHNKLIYNFIGDRFCFERHANIDAHRILLEIYDDSKLKEISQIYYMHLLTYLYEKTSPVEETLKLLLIKNNLDITDISTQKKIAVGFPLDKKTLNRLDNICIKEARGDITFSKA